MDYKEKNDKKIESALARLVERKNEVTLQTLTDIMQMAMNIAFDLHEIMGLHLHLEVGDDYGWMITHGGVPVKYEVYTAAENKGTVRERLMSLTWMSADHGWSAILMAGMQAAAYHVEREKHILDGTLREVASNVLGEFAKNWQSIK